MNDPRRSFRACTECGCIGRRVGNLCQLCSLGSPAVLTAGHWVLDPRRHVLVWQRRGSSTASVDSALPTVRVDANAQGMRSEARQ